MELSELRPPCPTGIRIERETEGAGQMGSCRCLITHAQTAAEDAKADRRVDMEIALRWKARLIPKCRCAWIVDPRYPAGRGKTELRKPIMLTLFVSI